MDRSIGGHYWVFMGPFSEGLARVEASYPIETGGYEEYRIDHNGDIVGEIVYSEGR